MLVKPRRQPRHKPKLTDLPPGANNNDLFAKFVLPNFIGIILAGDECFDILDIDISTKLAKVCKYAYGGKVKIDTNKGSVAFALVGLPFVTSECRLTSITLFRPARGSAQ